MEAEGKGEGPSTTSRFGFKEWKLVCDVLEQGQQSILLRKGGISEGKDGFQWIHPSFFLFPSYFHEQARQLRLPEGWKGDEEVPTAEREKIEIRLFAEIVETHRLTDLKQIHELEPFHAWNREVVEERFQWGDEPGLSLALIDVYKLKEPWVLENRKGFGGCRSWLGLPEEEGLPSDWFESLERITDGGALQAVREVVG